MRTVIAYLRMATMIIILIVGCVIAVLSSFFPQKTGKVPFANRVVRWIAKSFLLILNVKLECPDRKRLKNHRGFIFPNHDSFLDIILPISIGPVRFLAKAEVKKMPFIGRLATSVGTIFVDRSDQDSRDKARQSLTKLDDYPPILIYPEGMIDGKPGLSPFRYGAFEIAKANQMPYLLVAVLYDDFWNVRWKDEPMLKAVKRVAMKKRVNAKMIPLEM
ncbi:MAG TPA: hypothetical protein ENJ56_03830, partial [Anaerolineae bacterium]|nr:hypothetical protein [Anaerolineae bacterium]